MNHKKTSIWDGVTCLVVIILLFGGIGYVMGVSQMLNTIMKTAHDLLLNTVFYLMGVTVITGAIGKIFIEFGVVNLLEKILRPMMRPIFNLKMHQMIGHCTFLDYTAVRCKITFKNCNTSILMDRVV